MSKIKIIEAVDFAIERELEAAAFYRNLSYKAAFSDKLNVLAELEKFELGHVKLLQSLRNKDFSEYQPEKIIDLELSDYLTVSKPVEELRYEDILVLAMKREAASIKLYSELAKREDNEAVKNIFLKLADEESKHKFIFENIYDKEVLKEN